MGLRLKFKKKLPFHDLDINYDFVAPITAIMGASGSGKSTLFQCISGLKKNRRRHHRIRQHRLGRYI